MGKRLKSLRDRMVESFQPLGDLAFAFLWSLLLTFAAMFPLWRLGHRSTSDFLVLTAIWFFGSFLAGFMARYFARLFTGRRPAVKRFAAMIFFLFSLTCLVTAAFFSLQYRMYFSQWHDTFFTKYWFIQFIFTGANSFYLFVASAVEPLIRPLNVVLALALCWVFKPQPTLHEANNSNQDITDRLSNMRS